MRICLMDDGGLNVDTPVIEVESVVVVPTDGSARWATDKYEQVVMAVSTAAVFDTAMVFYRAGGGAVIVGPTRLRNAIVLVSE